MSDRLIRVNKWEEFKRLVNELKPDSIVYNIEQTGISKNREFTSLRLIIPSKNYYVYVDFPKGDALRETAIPIHKDATGTRCIEDDDIRAFLKRELGEKLPVY
ncbi:hypothetical protein MUP42_01200, partial [Candidatus Bathyarchaeota archaeon]|nr:hypothetical protein [Candidatus Bathyarchaeota archaeon]